jgi:hypothetical protein
MHSIPSLFFLVVITAFAHVTAFADISDTTPDADETVRVDVYLRGWGILADDSHFENLDAVRDSAHTHVIAKTVYSNVRKLFQFERMQPTPKEAQIMFPPLLVIDVRSKQGVVSTYLADRTFLYTQDGKMRIIMGCDLKLSLTPKLWLINKLDDNEIQDFVCQ